MPKNDKKKSTLWNLTWKICNNIYLISLRSWEWCCTWEPSLSVNILSPYSHYSMFPWPPLHRNVMLFLKAQKKGVIYIYLLLVVYQLLCQVLYKCVLVHVDRWKIFPTHKKWDHHVDWLSQASKVSLDNQKGQYEFLQGSLQNSSKYQIKKFFPHYINFINVEFFVVRCTVGQTNI